MYISHSSHVTGVVAVHAAPFLAAHVPTAVWNLAALPLGICHFTCNPKKEVKGGKFHFKVIADCDVTRGSSHCRSRCRRLDV